MPYANILLFFSVPSCIDNPTLHEQVLSNALAVTQNRYNFFSSTIQVEIFDEASSLECSECLEVK